MGRVYPLLDISEPMPQQILGVWGIVLCAFYAAPPGLSIVFEIPVAGATG